MPTTITRNQIKIHGSKQGPRLDDMRRALDADPYTVLKWQGGQWILSEYFAGIWREKPLPAHVNERTAHMWALRLGAWR